MASRRLKAAAPPARQKPPLHVELLEDIFLRLSSPVDLARVSAACFVFRCVIAGPHFLRQYRAVHPPLLLGCLLGRRFLPAVAPHPNAAAARAVAAAVNGFNFEYLFRGSWRYSDVCEGRVLLQRSPEVEGVVFQDLAVCDPLSRRFRLLPPIPGDLIVSTQVQKRSSLLFQAFLVPSGHLEDTSFKVIARTHCRKKLVIFIFCSESCDWNVGASTSWSDLGFINSPLGFFLSLSQYEHGCFYWKVDCWSKMLKLDINRMVLSSIDLPADHAARHVVIAEEGEGRLAIFSQKIYGSTLTLLHYYTIIQDEGDRANGWQMEKTIPLPCKSNLVGASAGHVFLIGSEQERGTINPALYSLEMKTLKIERLCSTEFAYGHIHAHPYFGFPPFLSPRRI